MKNFLLSIVLFCSLGFWSRAQTFEVEALNYSGDPEERINFVILGDGYQESEFDKFIADANAVVDKLFNTSPYTEYRNYINVYAIKVPSNESGASHPGTATDETESYNEQVPVSYVDNYFGSTFDYGGIHRCLWATNSSRIYTVLANNFPLYDYVIILVNTPYYGGCGYGGMAVTSTDFYSADIAIHELGHSFGNLRDEYWAGDQFAREGINMTRETNPALVRWKNWYGDNMVGIYQHCCGGTSSEWYKPYTACKMQKLTSIFCPVCKEGLVERIHSLTTPINSYYPVNDTIVNPTYPIDVGVSLLEPTTQTLKKTWEINGVILEESTNSLSIEEGDLQSGFNEIIVRVEDVTSLLRVDNHSHIYSTKWIVKNGSDEDNDGVFDVDDICPNTPAGESVDPDGCSESQKDNVPPVVTQLEISEISTNSFKVDWSLDEGSKGYVRFGTSPGTYDGLTAIEEGYLTRHIQTVGPENPYALNPGTTYFFQVYLEDESGNSGFSAEYSITTLNEDSDGDGITDDVDQCPDTPEGVDVNSSGCSECQIDNTAPAISSITVTNITINSFTVNWSLDEDSRSYILFGTSGDNLEYSTSNDNIYKTSYDQTVGGNNPFPLNPDTVYFYRVYAEDECGNSNLSVISSLRTDVGDEDGDGINDDEDQCPDTPSSEVADENGCSESQKDTDGDGIMDNEDLCPSEAGPTENNGCPWPDSDGDGITDNEDLCPNTALGQAVDQNGCELFPFNAFTVYTETPACPGVNDGLIEITASSDTQGYVFDVQLTGNGLNESYTDVLSSGSTYSFTDLAPGSYSIIISLDDGFRTDFSEVVIEEATDLSAKKQSIDKMGGKVYYTVSGNNEYTVLVNSGKYEFKVDSIKDETIAVPISYGENTITIRGADCQSLFQDQVALSSIKVYPNPVDTGFYLTGGYLGNVSIYNSAGVVVKTMKLTNSEEHYIHIGELAPGVYFVTLLGENREIIKVVKR